MVPDPPEVETPLTPRLRLHEALTGLTEHVYYQPPNNIELQFPCIKYERNGGDVAWAANRPYRHAKRYSVTVIDRDPDSTLPDQVEQLPYCGFDRSFQADNLNHWVFNLFF